MSFCHVICLYRPTVEGCMVSGETPFISKEVIHRCNVNHHITMCFSVTINTTCIFIDLLVQQTLTHSAEYYSIIHVDSGHVVTLSF